MGSLVGADRRDAPAERRKATLFEGVRLGDAHLLRFATLSKGVPRRCTPTMVSLGFCEIAYSMSWRASGVRYFFISA